MRSTFNFILLTTYNNSLKIAPIVAVTIISLYMYISITFLMKKVEGACNLIDNLTRLPLGEVNAFLNPAQQLATVNLLEHEIELLLVLEELDQLDDIRMALAMVERLDLLEYPGTRVSGDLVDDLHSVLEIRVEGRTTLNRGVSAFSENLTGQFVQFCRTAVTSVPFRLSFLVYNIKGSPTRFH